MAEEPTVADRRDRWPWAGWILLAAALVVTAAKLAWALTVISGRLYPPLPDAELGQIEDQRGGSSWIPILQMRAPDVQAALTVLGGGTFAAPLDLHGTDLRRADLTGANLGEARLGGADLKGAVFVGADLRLAHVASSQL